MFGSSKDSSASEYVDTVINIDQLKENHWSYFHHRYSHIENKILSCAKNFTTFSSLFYKDTNFNICSNGLQN